MEWRYSCPKIKVFCVTATTVAPKIHTKPGEYPTSFYAGQPVLVKMPQNGAVPMVLITPENPYAWEAKDCSGEIH